MREKHITVSEIAHHNNFLLQIAYANIFALKSEIKDVIATLGNAAAPALNCVDGGIEKGGSTDTKQRCRWKISAVMVALYSVDGAGIKEQTSASTKQR